MKFLDSSIWIAHFVEANKKATEIITKNDLLFSSILSLFEVKKKLLKDKTLISQVDESIEFIKNRSIVVDIDEDIVNSAVGISIKNKLGAVDSLIYASSVRVGVEFVTADNDFRDLKNVEIIE